MDNNYANSAWVQLKKKPEILDHVHRFRYAEQRKGGWGSWVADARGVVLIVQYLPGNLVFSSILNVKDGQSSGFLIFTLCPLA